MTEGVNRTISYGRVPAGTKWSSSSKVMTYVEGPRAIASKIVSVCRLAMEGTLTRVPPLIVEGLRRIFEIDPTCSKIQRVTVMHNWAAHSRNHDPVKFEDSWLLRWKYRPLGPFLTSFIEKLAKNGPKVKVSAHSFYQTKKKNRRKFILVAR